MAGSPFGYVRGPIRQGRPQPPPKAVGVVLIGAASRCCRGTGIQYTVYPDARTAREWMFGPGTKPVLSIWRLKQLSSSSLPHPRLRVGCPATRQPAPSSNQQDTVASTGRSDRGRRSRRQRDRQRHDLLPHQHPTRQSRRRHTTDQSGSRAPSPCTNSVRRGPLGPSLRTRVAHNDGIHMYQPQARATFRTVRRRRVVARGSRRTD